MKQNRVGIGLIAATSLLIVESIPMEADAQSAVENYKTSCEGVVMSDSVFRYMTGKDGKYKSAIFTTKSKTLTLNGPQFSVAMPHDGGDYSSGDVVSLPFTSTKSVKVAVDMANLDKNSYEVSVCAYDLKKSAKGWDDFKASDLVATYGRRLKGGTGPMTVTVPPYTSSDTRGSDVILINVVHFVSPPAVPVFKANLSQVK